jgi:anti-sigma factor RsiW
VVNLDVAAIQWAVDDPPAPGTLTSAGLVAGTGDVLAAYWPLSPAAGFGALAGMGLTADVLRSLSPRTNVEAVWKASIIQSDTYLMQASAPVYVRAGDLGLYEGDNSNRVMTSNEPPPQRSLVQLRYVQ